MDSRQFNLHPHAALQLFRVSSAFCFFFFLVFFNVSTKKSSSDLLPVHMATVFKTLANIITTFGDWYFYGQVVTWEIVGSLGLLFFGAVSTGGTEVNLNMYALFWMGINCLATSCYVLYIRKVEGLDEFSKVFYNSAISLPFILPLIAYWGEFPGVIERLSVSGLGFWLVFIANGFCGFFISLFSFWCMKASSPTTYSMVGAINKIPLCILTLWFFDDPITFLGFIFLMFTLGSGGLYAYAKIRLQNQLKSKF